MPPVSFLLCSPCAVQRLTCEAHSLAVAVRREFDSIVMAADSDASKPEAVPAELQAESRPSSWIIRD